MRSDCIVAAGFKDKDGYAFVGVKKKQYRAHRLSWELANGTIPEGLIVCHHCDNPPCINPDHLFLGTHADNTEDKVSKGRQKGLSRFGERNPLAKLTNEQVSTLKRGDYTESMKELAIKWGVHRNTLYEIKRGKNWR